MVFSFGIFQTEHLILIIRLNIFIEVRKKYMHVLGDKLTCMCTITLTMNNVMRKLPSVNSFALFFREVPAHEQSINSLKVAFWKLAA